MGKAPSRSSVRDHMTVALAGERAQLSVEKSGRGERVGALAGIDATTTHMVHMHEHSVRHCANAILPEALNPS